MYKNRVRESRIVITSPPPSLCREEMREREREVV